MVVEPPGEPGRRGVFEIHDNVCIAIKGNVIELSSGPVRQPVVEKLRLRVDALAVEAGENSGGGSAVETTVMIMNTNSFRHRVVLPAFPVCVPANAKEDRNRI